MRQRIALALLATLTLSGFASAKEKQKKSPLPLTVLNAKTISIIIDPQAGRSLENPLANQTAQKDVEAAILKWGRFQPMLSTLNADLIIVLRKGSGRIADATMPDSRSNGRFGSITPSDDGISAGAQRGNQPGLSNRPPQMQPQDTSGPQAEISNPEDSFLVYDGRTNTPLDSPAIWRYIAQDGLRPHSVPAVDAFRKAVAETEKIAASKNP
ncbi:hypothetical protein [Edaphobacter aggregans]|uniref:hypothetical protein n=1 Tax=Edaphobacter aggregans TaxID=570835 RepID=UPI0005503A8C|nr:hypothetical protein [Edaphobacter aggregans]